MYEKINQQQGAFKTEGRSASRTLYQIGATARGIAANRALPTAGKCVDCRFCHSKFFDALMAASNMRSEFMGFMRENARGARAFQLGDLAHSRLVSIYHR